MSKRISFYTNLIYFIVITLFVVIRICSNFGVFAFMGDYGSYIMGMVTQIGLIFLLPFFLFKLLNKFKLKENFKFFSFKKVSYKTIIASIALGLVVFCLNVYVSSFFNGIIQFFGYHPSVSLPSHLPVTWWTFLLNLFVTAVLPAFCEESLHRGMLLKGNSHFGMKKSIIFSGLMFGLLHLNVEQFFYATIIGLFLGYLCWSCNSIYPCVIVHFMNNATSVFLSFAADKGWAIGRIFENISEFLLSNHVLGFIIFVLFLCLLLVLAYELTMFLIKDSFVFNFGKKHKELANKAIRENYFRQIDAIKNDGETNQMFSTDKHVIHINLKNFLDFINQNMNQTKKPKEEVEQKEDPHMDLKIKILMYGSICLTAIVTAMTFIWGLFR